MLSYNSQLLNERLSNRIYDVKHELIETLQAIIHDRADVIDLCKQEAKTMDTELFQSTMSSTNDKIE